MPIHIDWSTSTPSRASPEPAWTAPPPSDSGQLSGYVSRAVAELTDDAIATLTPIVFSELERLASTVDAPECVRCFLSDPSPRNYARLRAALQSLAPTAIDVIEFLGLSVLYSPAQADRRRLLESALRMAARTATIDSACALEQDAPAPPTHDEGRYVVELTRLALLMHTHSVSRARK